MEKSLHIKSKQSAFRNQNLTERLPMLKIKLLVPCHRIIKSNLKIGGYLGGTDKKMLLIDNKKTLSKKYKHVMIFINVKHIFR